MKPRDWLFIVAITTFGTMLRLFHIGTQSLWLDEVFSVFLSRRDLEHIIEGTAQDTMPPLYYLLLHIPLQFGSDEVAARSVSFLFSVASIPFCYVLARTLFNTRVAATAAIILAINPLHVFYAQEARMYASLSFFVLGAMFFFVRAWRAGQTRDWIGFGIFQTFAFYTHSLAFLNLVALDVFALSDREILRERLRALVVAHAGIILLFAPWVMVLLQQAARVQSGFWAGLPSPLVLLTTPYLFLFSNVVPPVLFPIAFFIAMAWLVFAVIRPVRMMVRDADNSRSVAFAIIVLIVPIVALYLLSLFRPIYIERTLLPASIGLYLLLARAAVHDEPRWLNVSLAVTVFLVTLSALSNYYLNPDAYKPPMRDAARTLEAQIQPNDIVAHTSDSSALAFAYYQPDLPNHFLSGDPDYAAAATRGQTGRVAGLVPEDLDAIAANHARLWLVVALDHNVEYQKARVAELDTRYRRVSAQSVARIDLLLYDLED